MKEGRIIATRQSITKDYRTEVLEKFFEKSSPSPESPELSGFSAIRTTQHGERILQQIESTRQVLMIATPTLENSEIGEKLAELAGKRVRIYIVVNKLTPEVKKLTGKCLIRYESNIEGSIILSDTKGNSPQGLWFSQSFNQELSQDNKAFSVKLEEEQIQVFYLFYCHCFWNQSIYEIQNQKDLKNRRSPLITSFGYVSVPQDYFHVEDWKMFFHNAVKNTRGGADIFISTSEMVKSPLFDPYFSSVNVLTSLEGNDSNLMDSLSEMGEIWAGRANPFHFFLTEKEGYFFPQSNLKSDRRPWVLKLSPDQHQAAYVIWENIKKQITPYQFHSTKTIKEIRGEIRFLEQPEKEYHWEETLDLELKDRKLEKFEMFETSNVIDPVQNEIPFSLDLIKGEKFAQEIHYSFLLHPPYSSKKWEEDPLNRDWEKVNTEFRKRGEELLEKLKQREKKLDSAEKEVKAVLKDLFLGESQKNHELRKKLEKLCQITISDEKEAKRKLVLPELEEIEKNTSHNDTKIDLEIRKVEQQIKWEEKRDTLLAEKETLQQELSKITSQVEEQKKKKDELKKQREKSEQQLDRKKREIERHGPKFIFNKESSSFSEKKSSLEGVISPKKETSLSSGSVSRKQKIRCPNEDLPKVGMLYWEKKSKKRYLEITSYEEVKLAKKEAKRLHAEICIKQEE